MATYTKHKLSDSVNGRGVLIVASGTPGTTFHTVTSTANEQDEVWLWGVNHGTSQADVTLELGGTTSGDRLEVGIPPQQGLVALVPGLTFSGGVTLGAYATAPLSGVTIFGFVNRITP